MESSQLSQENKKQKKALEKRRETRLATSPMLLFRRSFKNLKDETVELNTNQIKDKCFEALGLMEEYYREPTSEVDIKRTASGFEMEGVNDLDDYLKLLDTDKEPETFQEKTGETDQDPAQHHRALVTQHRGLIKSQIQKLLAIPQVRNLLRTEFTKELKKFKNAQSKLQRLQRVKHAIERATLDMHSTYLESKRKNHGVLVASASKKIEKLSDIVGKAEKEKKETVTNADSTERGFIATQELLEYKRQMKEKGFALTPSRRALLQKIVEHSMAGQKVFLVGSTGTGKTELAFYAVNEVTGEYEIIPWHEGTVVKDIMGQMQLTQNATGQVESSFKPGPLVRGYTKGRGVIHEEITAGSTRTMMGMKPYLNLRPGQAFKIPEMNGTVLQVNEEILMEVFTGNPKSEQTQEREDLDPAILRMMKGIQVEYMPANELAKIVMAKLMDESGVLKLSKSDIQLIEKLADAANLMQMCHENALDGEAAQAIKTATGIDDLRITKNFLDPGTFLELFAKFDYERSKGKSLREYLREELDEFLHDPKNINAPEERKLALAILQLKGVLKEGSTLEEVKIVPKTDNKEKAYILPSEMGFLLGDTPKQEDDPYSPEDAPEDADIQATVDDIKDMLGGPAQPSPPENAPADLASANKLIDKLSLNPQAKEKLKEMLAGYDEAAATAKDLDPNVEIKSFLEVSKAFLKLGKEKLKAIAEFGKPTLVLTPKNTFLEKKTGMDLNKKYDRQADTWHWEDPNSPYKEVKTPTAATWSVVDGSPNMPHIDGIPSNSRFDERKRLFKEHFKKKNMRLINVHEYAALQQRSLREHQKAGNDTSKIVDFYKTGNEVITCLDDADLTDSSNVAYGYFYAEFRKVNFAALDPGNTDGGLRGRPSVQFL